MKNLIESVWNGIVYMLWHGLLYQNKTDDIQEFFYCLHMRRAAEKPQSPKIILN